MVGSGGLLFPHQHIFHFYENICFALCMESSTIVWDYSQKVVRKNPQPGGLGIFDDGAL